MQGAWHHGTAHQAPCDWREQDQDSRPRRPVSPQGPRPFGDENWPNRGRDSDPHGQHPPEGREKGEEAVEEEEEASSAAPGAGVLLPDQMAALFPSSLGS